MSFLAQASSTSSATSASSSQVVNTDLETPQTVTTSIPTISGTASTNILVTLDISSTNGAKIVTQVRSDTTGHFSASLIQLGKELANGSYTLVVSYKKPSGNIVQFTRQFTVAATKTAAQTVTSTTTTTQATPTPNPVAQPNSLPVAGAGDVTAMIVFAGFIVIFLGLMVRRKSAAE